MTGPHNRSDSVIPGDQSQQDATELNRPLEHPKNIMKIGNWYMLIVTGDMNTKVG